MYGAMEGGGVKERFCKIKDKVDNPEVQWCHYIFGKELVLAIERINIILQRTRKPN